MKYALLSVLATALFSAKSHASIDCRGDLSDAVESVFCESLANTAYESCEEAAQNAVERYHQSSLAHSLHSAVIVSNVESLQEDDTYLVYFMLPGTPYEIILTSKVLVSVGLKYCNAIAVNAE